jgi:hypothetical protein
LIHIDRSQVDPPEELAKFEENFLADAQKYLE